MTSEEIVLKRLKNPSLGKYPIHYKATADYGLCWFGLSLENYEMNLKTDLDDLQSKTTVKDRVNKILTMYNYSTYSIKNRFQCKPKSRRSVVDIWRIYKNYFEDIDIFPIMRTLYELVYIDRTLSTIKCSTVRKQVFWFPNMEHSEHIYIGNCQNSELRIKIRYWKNIGLNEGDDDYD